MPHQPPVVVSLFSGGMGLDLGLEQVGLSATLAVELDAACCQTIRDNRPALDVWQTDMATLTADAVLDRLGRPADVFLMAGGPPCQSFSPGGKRAGLSDPRGNLIYSYLKLVGTVRPRFFVLENVANLVTAALQHRPIADRPGKRWNLSTYKSGGGELALKPSELSGTAARQLVADAAGLGYQLSLAVADASEYGAPQKRLRFLLLGSRDGAAPALPPPFHGDRAGRPLRTVRDAIADLQSDPGPHSEYTPKVARYFALVPSGGNWRHLPKELQREALGDATMAAGGGKTGFYRRLAWDAPAPTITGRANRKGSALCHPAAVRPLSARECARLQGFPDDWRFSGSMNSRYTQVGNAVPVPLGAAVGRAVLAAAASPDGPGIDLELALADAVHKLRASARNKKSRAVDTRPNLF